MPGSGPIPHVAARSRWSPRHIPLRYCARTIRKPLIKNSSRTCNWSRACWPESVGIMLTIARRFNGPAHSGNGGYVAGGLAQRFLEEFGTTPGAKGEGTLRKPPPLEKPLTLRQPAETEILRLLEGTTVIAEAESGETTGGIIE